MMIKQWSAAAAFALVASLCGAQGVGKDIVCNPRDGVSTCMQGVLLMDDITMSIVTGASDEVVENTANWVKETSFKDARDFSVFTPRLVALAFKDGLSISPRKVALLRRVEVLKAKRFVLPIAQIRTLATNLPCGLLACSKSEEFFQLTAFENESRVKYSPDGADVCTTTKDNRFCVRLIGVGPKPTIADQWNKLPVMPASGFATVRPSFRSAEWEANTLLGVEIEILDSKPMAVDGARMITARPLRMVMFNHSYLAGAPLSINTQQAGEKK